MKLKFVLFLFMGLSVFAGSYGQAQNAGSNKNSLYMDVHFLQEGKVKAEDVAAAHAKDLAIQSKYGVQFIKYWVDESKGVVYCLSSAPDSLAINGTHRQAHGLMPQLIYKVEDGKEAVAEKDRPFFLDVHELGPNSVTAADVEKAHQKDLNVQDHYGVRFINYWVDEKTGTVLCLSQADDASKVIQTHKEAHGLVPVSVTAVKQGQ